MRFQIENILLKSENWQSLRSSLTRMTEKEKGDCFEKLTKLFLQIHPQYCTKIKQIWLLNEVPSNVRLHLNLPNRDEGIDLVAETRDNEYWAIQCKYLDDEDKRLTRATINSFTDLAFTICKNISFALVCTTADRYSYKLSMYGDRLGFCSGDTWRELDGVFFEHVHELLKGRHLPLSPAVPRDHQKEALTKAISYFSATKNSRGKLIMPCGTGKSLTSFWISEALNAQSILVAVPSLALIRQSLFVWTRESIANKQDIDWICVCSDETVGDIERDDAVVLTQDLGIRVHTDINEIKSWLKASRGRRIVVFSTYQSGKTIAEASGKAGIVFDLGIFDEAHKTVGNADSLFSYLLHNDNISIERRVFMTATERRYLGSSEQIASMDNPSLYGDTFYLLSFRKALESNPPILCDYKIVTMIVDRSEISELIRKNIFVKPDRGNWDEEVESEMLAAAVALRKAMITNSISHAVSFHKSVARAKAFKTIQDKITIAIPEYGTLDSFHVSGKTPTGSRAREIESFSNANIALITNARCLTEGVDVPNMDCVLFADPKKSTVDIVQAVGRALRPSPKKQFGFILIPIIVDNTQVQLDLSENAPFTSILRVLRALGANDDRIVDHFRSISQGKRVAGGIIDFDFNVRKGIPLDTETFLNSIQLCLWSRLAKLSWRPFEDARNYVQSLGLSGQSEWFKFCSNEFPEKGKLPKDIPTNPHREYEDGGWTNYGDWLGTGRIATRLRQYRAFEMARQFARGLKLKNAKEWQKFCKGRLLEKGTLPEDIPSSPAVTYKNNGWVGFGDWLGTGAIAPPHYREYRRLKDLQPFEEAREFAHGLKLRNTKEWRKFCKGQLTEKGTLPENIPSNPNTTYKNSGWKSFGDWLGTGVVSRWLTEYRPFEEARDYIQSLKLKSQTEWRKFCTGQLPEKGTLPKDIPANPNQTYRKSGWIGMGDWLGTGVIAPHRFRNNRLQKFRPFEEARDYIRSLKLKGQGEWWQFCKGQLPEKGKLPEDIPSNPHRTYKNIGWKSTGDWLGTGTIAPRLRHYRTYEDAREFARGLGLRSEKEWRMFCKGQLPEKGILPENIPAVPHSAYKAKGWKSMGDWLGTGVVASKFIEYRPFKEARAFAHGLGLRSANEWRKFCKGQTPEKGTLPKDIPANPNQTYKNRGWTSFGDWLGTGAIAPRLREYRPFTEARGFASGLRLKNGDEWRKFCTGQLPEKGTLPKDIPANPNQTYRKSGWIGMGDWLGIGTNADQP